MGSSQNPVFRIKFQLLPFSLILLLSSTFFHQHTFSVQGRQISPPNLLIKEEEEEEKRVVIKRELIGSRPPRCEGRCRNCGHCEAIQVPIIPQQQGFPRNHFITSKTKMIGLSSSRGDSLSNYKPMSWKCKCGDSIYNP